MQKSKLPSLPGEKKKAILEIVNHSLETLESFKKNYPARLQKAREAAAKRDPLWDSW